MLRRHLLCLTCCGFFLIPSLLLAQPPGRGGPQGGPQGGQQRGPQGGPQGGQRGGQRGGPPAEFIMQIFQQADANEDGTVTKAELTALLQAQEGGGRGGRRGQPNREGQPMEQRGFGDRPRQGGGIGERGERGDRQGPPPREGGAGEHGRQQHGPPEPGQILPPHVAEMLELNERQAQLLTALQADIDKRLESILTDEQVEQLKTMEGPRGPERQPDGEGNRDADRPQRPSRPARDK